DGVGQFGGPGGGGLAGAGVDQVDRQPVEGARGQVDGAARLGGGMVAAQEGQGGVIERLNPQRQAVDAGVGQGRETAGLGVGGVGLQRDLDGAGGGQQGSGGLDDAGHGVGRHQRRGAAAEEDRGQGAGPDPRRLGRQVVQYRLDQRGLFVASPPV